MSKNVTTLIPPKCERLKASVQIGMSMQRQGFCFEVHTVQIFVLAEHDEITFVWGEGLRMLRSLKGLTRQRTKQLVPPNPKAVARRVSSPALWPSMLNMQQARSFDHCSLEETGEILFNMQPGLSVIKQGISWESKGAPQMPPPKKQGLID